MRAQSQLNRTGFFRRERAKALCYFIPTNFTQSANSPYNGAHSKQAVSPPLPKLPVIVTGEERALTLREIKQGILSSPGAGPHGGTIIHPIENRKQDPNFGCTTAANQLLNLHFGPWLLHTAG